MGDDVVIVRGFAISAVVAVRGFAGSGGIEEVVAVRGFVGSSTAGVDATAIADAMFLMRCTTSSVNPCSST